MGVSFFERMSGHIDVAGTRYPVDVELKCEVPDTGVVRDGVIQLSGLIRARPWADDLPVNGTLTVSFLKKRTLEYRLWFQDVEGTQFTMSGRKDLGITRPFLGMTKLKTTLWRGTNHAELKVGEGEISFQMDDLPSFVASLKAGTARKEVDIPAQLEPDEWNVLMSLGEALVVRGNLVPEFSELSLKRAEQVLLKLPPVMQSGFKAAIKGLDATCLVNHGTRFSKLSPEDRRGFLNGAAVPGLELLTRVLGLPLMIGHFGRRDYLDAVGVPDYKNPVREADERWVGQVVNSSDLGEKTLYECDVVVVGTGAGGAPVAAMLAARGFAVAMIEEGEFARRPQFAGGPEERLGRFWRDSGTNLIFGNAPLMIPTGKVVGGSTTINSGTCFGTPDAVLREWRANGFPEDFEPESFKPYLDRVREELRVEDGKQPWLGQIADRIAKGAEAMRSEGHSLEHGPLPRNAPGCDGQGLCAVGCPTGAKRSTDVSWVPRALKSGAFCFTGMSLRHIMMRGDKAVAIEARGQDHFGVSKTLHIKARAVVLACGTLQTPLILQESGIRLPRLGKGLSVHPALGFNALFAQSLGKPWQAIPQSYGVEGFVNERLRFEGFYVPPSLMAATLPFHGQELTRWMENVDRLGQFGFMVRDRNTGSVSRGVGGRPLIRYTVEEDTLTLFRQGSAALAELMIRGGAEEVCTGIRGVPVLRTVEDAKSLAEMRLKPWHFQPMAFHPLGTCAMGVSEKAGVVDFSHRVFGTHNVYVVDGSSVPTSLGVNPQLTIMAMALRAADLLAAQL